MNKYNKLSKFYFYLLIIRNNFYILLKLNLNKI